MQTPDTGTVDRNSGASCHVPALALKPCAESQPGKHSLCQTALEKLSYFIAWTGSPGWLPQPMPGRVSTGGQEPVGPVRGQEHLRGARGCSLCQGKRYGKTRKLDLWEML